MEKIREILFLKSGFDTRRTLVLHWVLNIGFIFVFSAALGIICLRLSSSRYGIELFYSYFTGGRKGLALLFLNLSPIFLLAVLVFFIFNRISVSVAVSGAAAFILTCVNYFKLAFRDDPFLASDMVYVSEATDMMGRYEVSLTRTMWSTIIFIVLASVFAGFFMKARVKNRILRICAPFGALALILVFYFGIYSSSSLYERTGNVDIEFSGGTQMNYWNDTDQYCSRGMLYPFIYSISEIGAKKPDGYNKAEAEAALAGYGGADIPEDKKVNFISIMLEAYYDMSEFAGITLEKDPYEFFHELQAISYTGELVTNVFAGGTIDTERGYITGSTQLYDYRGKADSFAHYFAGQGYFTEFCHPGYGWFYNRQNVMEYLGFESVHFFEDRYDNGLGYIMNDDVFFDDLIYLFEEAVGMGTPYFNFSVTYQNHGPYETDILLDTENEYAARGDLSEYAYNVLNNYLYGISMTDNALRDFIGYFEESAEPVVIVLFGDHKPWLGDSNSVYAELGADFSLSSADSFYQYYNTQYVIWANEEAKKILGNEFTGYGGSFSPCFLMMKVFDLCGYEGNSTMNALRELYEYVDVLSATGRFRDNGNLTYSPSDEVRSAVNEYRKMQYYFSFDMY